MSFQCVIVTPEHQVLDASVTQAIIPGHDGQVGILTNRAPLLLKLGAGELRVDPASGSSQRFYVEGGIAQMKDNRLTVLTERAIPVADVDLAAARADLEKAEAITTKEPAAAAQRQKALISARARIAIAQKRA